MAKRWQLSLINPDIKVYIRIYIFPDGREFKDRYLILKLVNRPAAYVHKDIRTFKEKKSSKIDLIIR